MACCVPKCRSKCKKGSGISFHEFPINPKYTEAWLKAISRKDFVPNTNSNSSKVCCKHFLESDFLQSITRKRLRPDAVPSIFPDYPSYMQKKPKSPRPKTSILKRQEAAKKVSVSKKKKRRFPAEAQAINVQVPEKEKPPAAEDKAVQVDCRILPVPERRMFMKKCSGLKNKLLKLQEKCDALAEELHTLKKECPIKSVRKLVKLAAQNSMPAVFILDQIKNFFKDSPRWSESTIRQCIIIRNLSSDCYKHIIRTKLLRLPSRVTLAKHVEGLTAVNPLVEQRVIAELEALQSIAATVRSSGTVVLPPVEQIVMNAVEQIVMDSVEQFVSESIEHIATECIEQTVAESIQQTVAESSRLTFAEPIQENAALPIEQTFAEPMELTVADSIQQTATEPMPQTVTESIDQTVTVPIQESVVGLQHMQQNVADYIQQTVAVLFQQTVTEPIQQSIAEYVQQNVELPIEPTVTVPISQTITVPPFHQTVAEHTLQTNAVPIQQNAT